MLQLNRYTGPVIGLLAMALPFVATASESNEDAWQYNGAIYLWGAGIGATTTGGDDIDMSFSDLVKNLDFAFMGLVEANKGKWSLLADVIYLNISDDTTTTANIVNRPVKARADIGMTAWIVTAAAENEVFAPANPRLDLLGGGRYLYLKGDLDFEIDAGSPLAPRSRRVTESDDVIDAVIGLRGMTELNDKWSMNYLVDVGTGQSDYTWQALAGFNYRFKRVDAAFGYRYMKYKFDDKKLFDDMDVSGPYGGVRFHF